MVMKRPDVSLTSRWLDAEARHKPEGCNGARSGPPSQDGAGNTAHIRHPHHQHRLRRVAQRVRRMPR